MKHQKGSVLIAVTWMLAVLSIFALAVSRQASQELLLGQWLRDRVAGRTLARAGVERALLEIQLDKMPAFEALNESWAVNEKAFREVPVGEGTFSVSCSQDGETYYGVCDESARVNLNLAGENPLKNLFRAVDPELEESDAVAIAQAIIDWRDGDDAQLADGAESSYYESLSPPYKAANAPFRAVEELSMVKGVTPELFQKVLPYVTVYSQGRVNLNTAPKTVLQALGLSPELAEKIAAFRAGADQVSGTKDDEIFQAVSQITESLSVGLSFSAEEFAQVSNAVAEGSVGVQSSVFRIQASGHLKHGGKNHDMMVTCVAKRDGTVLYWKQGAAG